MHHSNHKNKSSTVLIRIQKGRITLLGNSGGFPFPREALPEGGSVCPSGTGADMIIRGIKPEYKGEIPIERWIKRDYLEEGKSYVLIEHSLQLLDQILTLLEIEAQAEE